ncbi:lipopolysaccharide biosynthesis protein [Mucilaginibacter phyllosphaerae]|uniref:Lipopolysaccharide biosynthesis protein n=1 Tax=Mucilaginibacter phyllosphaerae TaxID=1812349 RepID=A0A4Y8AB76_9SPHI|nr:lipopolysaccharide biosynthesis protein [Mucilaginibacter phyllosphaerae]MBB3969708.1 hypothetical protein [Mucilaginibacter phyllosphaerae]TEW65091.1 lipopolysaccharide biosynthesis protein [Mucilaginibacter phyllosphaerae]GGH18034.1 hypothetical protein GCM10007352_28490 [Mucilaginibacter phyllosphaerae]
MDKINSSEPEEISVKDIILKYQDGLRFLKSKIKIILLCGAVGSVVGVGYAIMKKPVYTATCTFVLDDNRGGGLGQYASLAAFAGIDIAGGTGGVFEGDNIMELYKSRNMIKQALLSSIVMPDGKKQLLIDRYVSVLNLKKRWKEKDHIETINFNPSADKFNRKQDSLIIDISSTIANKILNISKPDKKLNVVKVDIAFVDELFSKEFNDKLVATVNDFYIKTKTKKAQKNLDILKNQVDSVKGILNQSLGRVASSNDATPNANPLRSILNVPSQRKQVDVQASSSIYAELVKNLELAKISLRQEMPLIQVIDEPIYPLSKSTSNKILYIVGGFFLMVLASVFILIVWGTSKKSKEFKDA